MNPGRSGAVTGSLPTLRPNANTRSYVSSLVARPLMTSTSFMIGTGLKKWRPMKRSGLRVAAASSVMQSDDVLLAKSVSGPTTGSRVANTSRFASTFSTIASTIRSQSARSSSRLVPPRLARVRSRSAADNFPRSTPAVRNDSIRPIPAAMAVSSTSRTIVR